MATSGDNQKVDVDEREKHLVHVTLRMAGYDERTGNAKYGAFPQKFTVDEFNQSLAVGGFEGYEVTIINKPEGYEIQKGQMKRQLATGPLLGQRQMDKGPAGSIATTAAATLAQTLGEVKLEGDHLQTQDNVLRKVSEQPTGTVLQYDGATQTTNEGVGILDSETKNVSEEPGPQGTTQGVELNDQRAAVVPNLPPLELDQTTGKTQDGPFANMGLQTDKAAPTPDLAPPVAPYPSFENLTPKGKLQADYEKELGEKPDPDLTMKQLAEAIAEGKK